MYCSVCGAQLPDDSSFCSACGAPVVVPQPEVQPQPAPQAAQQQAVIQVPVAQPEASAAAPAKNRKPLVIGIVAIVVAALAALGVVFFLNSAHAKTVDLSGGGQIKDPRVLTILAAYDTDNDGTVSEQEAATVESLTIDGASQVNGLGVFPNLKTLKVSDGSYTIDISDAPTIVSLDLSGAQVQSLNLGKQPNMTTLNLQGANVNTLDLSQTPELQSLNVLGTNLEKVDVGSAPKLESLQCDDALAVDGLDKTQLSEYWVVVDVTYVKPVYNNAVGGKTHYAATYDDQNRLVSILQQNGDNNSYTHEVNTGYSYDAQGNLVRVDVTGAEQETIDITYGQNGLPQMASSSKGRTYNYQYNDQKQLTSVTGLTSAGPLQYTYGYDANGRMISAMYSGGSNGENRQSTFAYDNEGRLLAIDVQQGGMLRERVDYTYASNGIIESVEYKAMGSQGYSESFNIDSNGQYGNGNRTTNGGNNMFYSYPSIRYSGYTYDDNGNLVGVGLTRRDDDKVETATYVYQRIHASPERAPRGTMMTVADPMIMGFSAWRPWEDLENPRVFATANPLWDGVCNPFLKPE